jgi:hypothetical protein
MVRINIDDKVFYVGCFVALIAIMGVTYAYGSGDPYLNGHDKSELEVDLPDCSVGDYWVMNNSEWICDSGGVVVGGLKEDVVAGICEDWGLGSCETGCPDGSFPMVAMEFYMDETFSGVQTISEISTWCIEN